MALKLDNRPGQVYDPEQSTPKTTTPDGSHDEGAISPAEQAKFDQIEAGERDIAALEKNAGSGDGNDSSTDHREKNLYKPEPDKKRLTFQITKKRATISGFVGGGIASAAIAAMIAFPGFLVTQIGDILTGVGDVQMSHDRRYRRSNYHRIRDIFSRDGRLGGRMITEMNQAGYRISFDPNDRNRIVGITRPGARVSSTGAGLADELIKFQDARHPFRLASFKTRRMEAFYNRYGVSRKSLVTPEAGPGRVSPDAIADINKRLKAAVDGDSVDTTPSRIGSTEGLTDEEVADAADEADATARNSGVFKELDEFTANGGKLSDFPDQKLVRAWQQSGNLINPEIIDFAEDAARGGSLGGKAFSTIKSFGVSTDIADKLCIIKKRLQTAVIAARVYRSLSMLRYTYAYMTAPDGVRKGEAQADLMKEVMKRVMAPDINGNYFGSSSGISYAMKGTFSKSRNDVTRSNIAVDGKLTGGLRTIQQRSDIPGCSLWQNPGFQIAVAAGEIALTVVSFGGFGAAKQAVSTGTREAIEAGFKASIKNAIKSSIVKSIGRSVAIEIGFEGIMTLVQINAERSLTSNFMAQEQGGELSDILIGGGGVGVKQRSLSNGQVPATTRQYGEAYTQYLAEKKEEIKSQSVYARFFNRENHDSLAFKTASYVAVNLNNPRGNFLNVQEGILNSPATIASRLLNIGGEKSYAQGSDEFSDDQIAFDTYNVEGEDNAGMELATDPAGNLLTYMPQEIITIDPELNKEELIDLGYVDEVTEEPIGDFAKHVELCVDGIDTITQIEAWEGDDTAGDCLAELPLTKKFKAHLAYLGAVDSIESELFPEEISDGSGNDTSVDNSGNTGVSIGDLTGPVIPCEGQARNSVNVGNRIDWDTITPTGTIGKNSAGQDINVFVRDACAGQSDVRTVVIGASIHGGENTGQFIAHEVLFNKTLPPDVRVIVIPEINKAGLTGNSPSSRFNKNGVNLNRNFDYNWEAAKPGEYDKANSNYKGPSAASEPETKAIQSFLESLGKTNLLLSYHSDKNWVAPSGPKTTVSRPISQRYSEFADIRSINNNNGYGFFESWYNNVTDSPALLVELDGNRSDAYVNKHADAIVKLVTDNVVK